MYINCFSHCNAGFSKFSVIMDALDGNIVSTNLTKMENTEEGF